MSLRTRYPVCPLCRSKNIRMVARFDARDYPHFTPPLPTDFNWMQCLSCNHIHTQHYWTPRGLQILFSKVHEGQEATDFDGDVLRTTWGPLVEKVTKLLGGYHNIYDQEKYWLD